MRWKKSNRILLAVISLVLVFNGGSSFAELSWDELELRRGEIAEQERKLVQSLEALPDEVRNPLQFTERLAKLLSTLTPEEKEMLHTTGRFRDKEIPGLPQAIQDGLKEISAFDAQAHGFQKDYDQYQRDRTLYISELYMRAAEDIVKAAEEAGVSEEVMTELKTELGGVRTNYDRFIEKWGMNDADKDKGWLGGIFDQHRALRSLSEKAGKSIRTKAEVKTQRGKRFENAVQLFKMAVAGLGNVGKTVFSFFTLRPMLKLSERTAKKVTNAAGWNMQFEGRENIPTTTAPNTLNVFLANHTTSAFMGMLDGVTLGRIMDKDPVLANGGLQGIPILSWFERNNPSYILVGQDKNAIEQISERVEAGKMTGFFAFPEGNTFEGNVYGLRPWNRGFSGAMLKALRQRSGFSLNIVPVSSPRHYRFWNEAKGHESDPTDLLVTIHKPIPPEVVDLMMASGESQVLERVVRQIWIEELDKQNSPDRRLGTPNIDALDAMNREAVASDVNCEAVMSKVGRLN